MQIENCKLTRPWQIWIAFLAALAVVVAAIGWLSWRAIESDHEQAEARRQAAIEENVRLALWRMDSRMAAFVAGESARTVAAYQGIGASRERHALPSDGRRPAGASLSLWPSPWVLISFQRDATGNLSSPQVPRGPGSLAEPAQAAGEDVSLYEARLARLKSLVNFEEIPPVGFISDGDMPEGFIVGPTVQNAQDFQTVDTERPDEKNLRQQELGVNEYRRRSNYVIQNNALAQAANPDASVINKRGDLGSATNMLPWVDAGELLLLRYVSVGDEVWLQGCWIDWEKLRRDLLAEISDLLPQAELTLVAQPRESEQTRMLAALPVRIDPGPVAASVIGFSPVRLALVVAWAAMALAALAVAVLLRGVIALSERRADFVSAVTHELRTPLTTFRMYAEMLAAGMVPDEAARARYLDTLRVEADRLTHLVENVLAYARLERGGLGNRIQPVRGDELLKLATERLAARARDAGMVLVISSDDSAQNAIVLCDASAVEQILFNLVDNACKYAAGGGNKSIELDARVSRGKLYLRVRDHGAGISSELRRRLFQPFRKSAEAAARTAPGVGLGLSLSRRLARDMRGELQLDEPTHEGAAFVLTLPTR
jgi:signal transduction histidine kinase